MSTHFSQTRSHQFSPKKHTEPAQWKNQEDVVIPSCVCVFVCVCDIGAMSKLEASGDSLQLSQ
jgi:hypothetical protein